jgi:hypothetical protein
MMPRDPLVLTNQLFGLTALDTALVFLTRALALTYSDACGPPGAGESAEVATARTLIEACERMQAALESHRHQILRRLAGA